MEIKDRIDMLESHQAMYQHQLDKLLSGGIDEVSTGEVDFVIRQINLLEKELASLRDVPSYE